MKVIFAHASGDTFEMKRFEQRVTPSTTLKGRKPVALVSDATRAHERTVAAEYTWPALPAHLRSLPDCRAMVRHWVRTDYQWSPTVAKA